MWGLLTPTLSNGRVYTFRPTGSLNALDAGNGAAAWSRNAASDTGKKIPDWGFASSPLVVEDIARGNRRWLGPAGGGGYSSPHRVTIDGLTQIPLLNGAGAISVAPADGTLLWHKTHKR